MYSYCSCSLCDVKISLTIDFVFAKAANSLQNMKIFLIIHFLNGSFNSFDTNLILQIVG